MTLVFVIWRRTILARLEFILLSGLIGGVMFFIIDLPATSWGAWSTNYAKTLGPMFGWSVLEELIWAILVFISAAAMIEVLVSGEK